MSDKTTEQPKLTERQLIRRALLDAVDWQDSFAEANRRGTPERARAAAIAAQYRALLKKKYCVEQTPMEAAFDGVPLVSIFDLNSGSKKDMPS